MKRVKRYQYFRKIALAEGISLLVLLFIAMPLKYAADMPMAVTIIGGIHGVLFLLFVESVLAVKSIFKKDFMWLVKAGLASIIPFGTFVMDRQWRREQEMVSSGLK